jgi:hypothetical protein
MSTLKPIACHRPNLCRTTSFTINHHRLANFCSRSSPAMSHILLSASRGLSICSNIDILQGVINNMHYFWSTRHNTWERGSRIHWPDFGIFGPLTPRSCSLPIHLRRHFRTHRIQTWLTMGPATICLLLFHSNSFSRRTRTTRILMRLWRIRSFRGVFLMLITTTSGACRSCMAKNPTKLTEPREGFIHNQLQ